MRIRAASAALAAFVAGCGSTDRAPDAAAVAERFHVALGERDGESACARTERGDGRQARGAGGEAVRGGGARARAAARRHGGIWIGTWSAQSVTGVTEYNTERLDHREDPVSWAQYLGKPDFWEKTLQNWQLSTAPRHARV